MQLKPFALALALLTAACATNTPYDNGPTHYEETGTLAYCFGAGIKLDPESEAAYMLARDGLMPVDEFRATFRMNYPRLRASVIDCLVDEIYPLS